MALGFQSTSQGEIGCNLQVGSVCSPGLSGSPREVMQTSRALGVGEPAAEAPRDGGLVDEAPRHRRDGVRVLPDTPARAASRAPEQTTGRFVGECHRAFLRESTEHVNIRWIMSLSIHWKMPLDTHIGSEVSMSGVQYELPLLTPALAGQFMNSARYYIRKRQRDPLMECRQPVTRVATGMPRPPLLACFLV